ncbi:MAG: type II secretion system protein [Candidatus Liptonbacteria bacterium]|nr:type II secretion system protein [Candidatus Liptonbacteria bacterium]
MRIWREREEKQRERIEYERTWKNKMTRKNKKNKSESFPSPSRSFPVGGFTLVEILVVLGITIFLLGMVMLYSAKSRTQMSLYVEAAKVAQVILRAKSLAIATYGTSTVPCGYGLHVDTGAKSYSMFSYRPVNPSPGGPPDCGSVSLGPIDRSQAAKDAGVYNDAETFVLPNGIGYGIANTVEDVMFLPPDPKTLIWGPGGGAPVAPSGDIVLVSESDASASVTIQVSSAGQISF